MVAELDVMISLDTSKAAVMREGCAAGAHLINDVRALLEPGRWRGRRCWRSGVPDAHAGAAQNHAGRAAL
jgi:hypothetical protein